ncbi:hypothetical protein [Mesonia maritima]|uniref:Uncharacterized protein n=1 Tax=Mesonia maritima TaxID=1793873 RepID=A0ABU1K6K1_9FLAO|nr:hypothetical protein [Mesonia maritima]MDR6301233.1 hypothetical protein [Mesonia maritima]
MGGIEDNHKKRKDSDKPLNEIGNRNEKTNKVDYNEKTIKKQENKK